MELYMYIFMVYFGEILLLQEDGYVLGYLVGNSASPPKRSKYGKLDGAPNGKSLVQEDGIYHRIY